MPKKPLPNRKTEGGTVSMNKANEITERIYRLYGTDSGVLLGIPPELRSSVEAIIKLAVNMADEED